MIIDHEDEAAVPAGFIRVNKDGMRIVLDLNSLSEAEKADTIKTIESILLQLGQRPLR